MSLGPPLGLGASEGAEEPDPDNAALLTVAALPGTPGTAFSGFSITSQLPPSLLATYESKCGPVGSLVSQLTTHSCLCRAQCSAYHMHCLI